MRKSKDALKHCGIFIIYILLTLLFTYPYFFHSTNTIFFGDPTDMIWHAVWAYDHLLKDPANLFNGLMFYPAKYTFIFTDHMIGTLIFFAPVYAITKNPILAHNGLLFFLTVLGAMSMYFLVYYWTKRRLPAFFSGFILAFSPPLLLQVINLPIIVAPLGLIFLDKFLRNEKFLDIIIFSLIFSFIVLSHVYLAYAIAFITAVYVTGYYIKVKKKYNKHFHTKLMLGILTVLILVLPFRLPFLKLEKEYGYKRKLGEMVQFSADPIGSYLSGKTNLYNLDPNYFAIETTLPGEKWLFQKVVLNLGDKFPTGIEKLPGETMKEKISYSIFQDIWKSGRRGKFFFGFIGLIFAFLGMSYMRKYNEGELKNIRNIYISILITFYIISLGPVLVILGHLMYIPLPDLLFYYIIPGFSSMRRIGDLGIVVFIFLTFFAGFGILKVENWIEKRFQNPKKMKIILFSVLFLLISVEISKVPFIDKNLYQPKFGDNIPSVYKWLNSQQIDGAVAELPTVKGYYNKYDPVYGPNRALYAGREMLYTYFSNYHKKPIINGWGAIIPNSFYQIRDRLYSIPDSSAVEYLKSLNIKTFILHTADFDPEDVKVWTDENIKKAGLKEVARFDDDIVLQFMK